MLNLTPTYDLSFKFVFSNKGKENIHLFVLNMGCGVLGPPTDPNATMYFMPWSGVLQPGVFHL